MSKKIKSIKTGKNSAIIVGEGFTVFIDGMPNKCECDSLGGNWHTTRSGKIIKPITFKQWASYTSELRDPLIYNYQEEINDPILETMVSCSKCKQPYSINLFEAE